MITNNPILDLALSKLDIDKIIRKTIAPGEHRGEAVLRVSYDLKVGEDFEQAVAQSVPWQKIAGVLFSKLNGVTVESVVREALAEDLDTGELAKRAKAATATLLDKAVRPVTGKVTGNVTAEVIG